jgi:hypothetical protein
LLTYRKRWAPRANDGLLGWPKGAPGESKLEGKEGEIRILLEKEFSKASVAKIAGVSRTAPPHFIRTRHLDPTTSMDRCRGRRPQSRFRSNPGGTRDHGLYGFQIFLRASVGSTDA